MALSQTKAAKAARAYRAQQKAEGKTPTRKPARRRTVSKARQIETAKLADAYLAGIVRGCYFKAPPTIGECIRYVEENLL